MKWFVLLCFLSLWWTNAKAQELSDTLAEISITALKNTSLRFQPLSSTRISQSETQRLSIHSLKGVSEVSPNFFIPDYGSRMTSSIYVRGLGARMDQPAVALNVDNVPFLNKDAYDMDVMDIESIQLLKGPQSTLYGRNSMAGVINISTLSPLRFEGVRVMAEAGTGNSYRASLSGYKKANPHLGFMLGGATNYTGGWFRNIHSGQRPDKERSANLRQRTAATFSNNWIVDNVASLTYSKQDGYPYAWEKTNEINYNDTCYYKRLTFTEGLTVKCILPHFTLASVSSFQFIDDDMALDQDFRPADYFTINQRRWDRAFTQDLLIRGSNGIFQWLTGIFGFYKHSNMDAPVNFKEVGISELIEGHRNEMNPDYPIRWDSRHMLLASHFRNTTYGLAAYHRTNFQFGPWSAGLGLRLDYEKATLNYRSQCNSGFTVWERETNSPFSHQSIDIDQTGSLNHDFVQFLPSVSLTRSLGESLIYATFSKGYKSGGFNNQMFSDVLQQKVMQFLGLSSAYDVDQIVSYKPETSYNYEAGLHVNCMDGQVRASAALFYIDCRDQQLTMFPPGSVTGRIMTNAGKTRSYGAEISMTYNRYPFSLTGAYGYTNATFVKYNDGKQNYKGKNLPYAPENTLLISGEWQKKIGTYLISLALTGRGAGCIYWDDSNEHKQPFYFLLEAQGSVTKGLFSLTLWGKNINNANYKTFRYVSMGNSFYQSGRPARMGVTLRMDLNMN